MAAAQFPNLMSKFDLVDSIILLVEAWLYNPNN